jgi:hypothetical protein
MPRRYKHSKLGALEFSVGWASLVSARASGDALTSAVMRGTNQS